MHHPVSNDARDEFGKRRQEKRNGVKACESELTRAEDCSEEEDVRGGNLLDGRGKSGRPVGVNGVNGVKIGWRQ
jgi:hypothetical protein